MTSGNFSLILGAQWGDEGKGKLVDILSESFDIVARATGGANAGHSVYVNMDGETKKFVFHLIPSGILYEHVICVIGNGVVLHVETMLKELANLEEQNFNISGRVLISDRAALLFDYHKIIDGTQEDRKGDKKVGTTKRGIGPCYADKINRRGLRMCDLLNWDAFVEKYRANLAWHQSVYDFEYDAEAELEIMKSNRDRLLEMMVDGAAYLNGALDEGKKVLLEGANACLLDIDHGTYPYVTSSNPTVGGALTGTGMSAKHLGENIGIVKAYMTRVGAGPFPTELDNELGEQIREAGGEFGSTTGRPRRCGWFDVPLTRYSIMLNGFTNLNLTKLDVLDELDEIQIATSYKLNGEKIDRFPALLEELGQVEIEWETMPGWNQSLKDVTSWDDLPENAKKYVLRLEELLGCPMKYIGVGQRRDQLITRA
ncbi:adenylosuccinate synthase [Candidatus Peregrinibacteria bacterium]|jgi:adenylosuccinate synthase|nr:adenylosuccinate synthase [Candidatus Peregrinibacteria bacterium]MBT5824158.1 adenylosuccinate synthase [Candidatus Peregrinibacteria bacterium]